MIRGYPWVKLHTGLLDNPRFARLGDGAKLAYFECLILAGRGDAGGLLAIDGTALSLSDLAFMLRCEPLSLDAALSELHRAGFLLLDSAGRYSVARWEDDQGPAQARKREDWRERQRKHRASSLGEEQDLEQEQEKEKDKRERERKRVTGVSPVTTENPTPSPVSSDFSSIPDLSEHIAVKTWDSLVGKHREGTEQAIIEGLGSKPDLSRLAAAKTEWLARGFRADNITGVLEWYNGGIPPAGESQKDRQKRLEAIANRPPALTLEQEERAGLLAEKYHELTGMTVYVDDNVYLEKMVRESVEPADVETAVRRCVSWQLKSLSDFHQQAINQAISRRYDQAAAQARERDQAAVETLGAHGLL